jgi:hypothetical protein
MNANTKVEAPVFRHPNIASCHLALDFDSTAQCINDTAELDQEPVACGLDDAPLVLGNLRIDQLGANGFEPLERALLVRAVSRE